MFQKLCPNKVGCECDRLVACWGTSFLDSQAQSQILTKLRQLLSARPSKLLNYADKLGRDARGGSHYTRHFEHEDF